MASRLAFAKLEKLMPEVCPLRNRQVGEQRMAWGFISLTITYVDAFLRLTVTPQITSESTIFPECRRGKYLARFSAVPSRVTQRC